MGKAAGLEQGRMKTLMEPPERFQPAGCCHHSSVGATKPSQKSEQGPSGAREVLGEKSASGTKLSSHRVLDLNRERMQNVFELCKCVHSTEMAPSDTPAPLEPAGTGH